MYNTDHTPSCSRRMIFQTAQSQENLVPLLSGQFHISCPIPSLPQPGQNNSSSRVRITTTVTPGIALRFVAEPVFLCSHVAVGFEVV